eukprot:6124783-Karenia_brevis.AAC.1
MDGWTYADWRLLPPGALEVIAYLYHRVEQGDSWPQAALCARSHPLNKDPSTPFQPLSYRFLLLS